jgi:predicted nucleic acid-binding protein
MRWCFEDPAPYAEKVLDEILADEQAHVPILWLYEVISVVAEGERAGILSAQKAQDFFDDLRVLEIKVDAEIENEHLFRDSHRLALQHRLTGYDAAYLELAIRRRLPLASLDKALNRAALAAGVPLFQP